MTVRTYTRKGARKPSVFRIEVPLPIPGAIPAGEAPIPMPELGGLVYSVTTACRGLEYRLLDPPEKVPGIALRCRHKVTVWVGERAKEYFFAPAQVDHPKGLLGWVEDLLKAERAQVQEIATKSRPPVFKRGDCAVDPASAARAAAMKLLRDDFPKLFQAIDAKASAVAQHRAWIADCWAKFGAAPDVDGMQQLAQDKLFTRWLAQALQHPGSTAAEDWALVSRWLPLRLYEVLSDADLASLMFKETGLEGTPGAWRKRAQRLGLQCFRHFGRPSKA